MSGGAWRHELSSAAEARVRSIAGSLEIGDFDRAREALLATAEQLLSFGRAMFVAEAAARLLEEKCRSASERCWLHARTGDATRLLGDSTGALAHYDQAGQLATGELVASIEVMRARCLIDVDRLEEADSALRRSAADPPSTVPALASTYWHERARLAQKRYHLEDALRCEEEALRRCEPGKQYGPRANVARALMDVGSFAKAEHCIRTSQAESTGTTDLIFLGNQLEILSDALLGQGELAAAEQLCSRSLSARQQIGVAGYIARSHVRRGWLMELQDRGHEAAVTYRKARENLRMMKGWTPGIPAPEISVALAACDVTTAAALSRSEATSPRSDHERLLLGVLRLAQDSRTGAAELFREVVQQSRTALAVCARNTCARRQLVVALSGLVAAGQRPDAIGEGVIGEAVIREEIDRFRSNIDSGSSGPVMELRYQLRMLHHYDRDGRTSAALDYTDALIARRDVGEISQPSSNPVMPTTRRPGGPSGADEDNPDAKKAVDFAILTAIEVERQAVCMELGLGDDHRVRREGRVYWRGCLALGGGEAYEIVVGQLPEVANVDAALLTAEMLRHWSPRAALLVGIAASTDPGEVKLGDVVVAAHVYYYERGKVTPGITKPEPMMLPADSALWSCAITSREWITPPTVARPDGSAERPRRHFGVIASGEKVLASEAARDQIAAGHRKILAIDMEGYGFSKAVQQSAERVRHLVVRGISDDGSAAKDDRWHGYAAAAVAGYVKHLLRDRPLDAEVSAPGGLASRR